MEPFAGLCITSSSSRLDTEWEGLIRRFGGGIRARVGGVLRRAGMRPHRDQIDEILQEVYCRLLDGGGRRLRRCRATSENQTAAFLGRVAERVALDQLRLARALKRGGEMTRRGVSDRALVDPRANPEERFLGRERLRLLLERCGVLAGRKDYRRNARILAMAAEGWSNGDIARVVGGRYTARSIEGLLARVRRYVVAHARAAAASLGETS
jgi:hypothetical protein